ncbi:MAG: DUF4062 domain-containing protein [Clostridia bacterium]|nr:DUF4062 domain-containing protein [Clostridia bacterium]
MSKRTKPVVFVSSTCFDLSQVRADLKEFIEDDCGFEPMLSDFNSFPIDPCIGTFENCLSNVDNYADVFVLVVGNRYGHVMANGKSITNLEYLHAKAKNIPIFVFVSKQLYDNLPLWRANKEMDFSAVVDNPQIFEFISGIYDEGYQWIYTFENARDIKKTLKNQFSLIFSDGLKLQKATKETQLGNLFGQIPPSAIRAMVEQPFAWEYKFLAHVLKSEFETLKADKWDLEYSYFDGEVTILTAEEFLEVVSKKFKEALNITNMLDTLLNKTLQDAIGEPGEPSNLELMVYSAKRFTYLYKCLVSWSLYFKGLQVDDVFQKLLSLLYDMPKDALNQIEAFVNEYYKAVTALPESDDGCDHSITITCALSVSNTEEINEEILSLHRKLIG